jgi:hypothetical protein
MAWELLKIHINVTLVVTSRISKMAECIMSMILFEMKISFTKNDIENL